MSEAFRSRWTDWTPDGPPVNSAKPLPYEPAKPSKPGFAGFAGAYPTRFSESTPPPVAQLAPVVPGPWPACPSCGRASGWRSSVADPTLRCLCGAPRPEPEPDPRCVRCRAPLPDPGNLLCASCYCAATAPKLARDPVGPGEIEPGDPATPTDGVRVPPPPAPEAQLDLLSGEVP